VVTMKPKTEFFKGRIIEYLKGEATFTDIMKECNMTHNLLTFVLEELIKDGIIEKKKYGIRDIKYKLKVSR